MDETVQDYDFMNMAEEFELCATVDEFKGIFGTSTGTHLWGKFTRHYHYSLLKMWSFLDPENRRKLVIGIRKFFDDVPF